jgi:sugar lactone lactonase YvrE
MRGLIIFSLALMAIATSCKTTPENTSNSTTEKPAIEKPNIDFPNTINLEKIAQNPEGIEFNKNDNTFFLSSLNATPIIKVNLDGTFKPFTSGEPYPMSTAGLQIDYGRNRLLATGFNGLELFDNDPKTKGMSNLRIYNLETGAMEKDINLSSLAPDAQAYFANDIAIDKEGNAYVSDWYAGVIYKVDMEGNSSVFWKNETGISSGPNGLDFHPDGYLLVSILNVNDKGLYADYGLVKIPTNSPESAEVINFSNAGFTGFDGMVITSKGNVIGVTNNGQAPGGNTLIELVGKNGWESAKVVNSKAITTSTTVAITPDNKNYVINQDFTNSTPEDWTIERVEF